MATTTSSTCDEIIQVKVKEKVKFLCSHGGKILPRPADGHLKYVGGETRVVSVPRDITFSELKKRLREVVLDGDMAMKYQLIPEDLDTLVSVKTEDDFKHMLHEYDRIHHSAAHPNSSPKLRTFLFPSPSHPHHHHDHECSPRSSASSLEQRYIDAINNSNSRSTCRRVRGIAPIVTNFPGTPTTLSVSSGCSSPTSNSPVEATPSSNGGMLHKVQSSPTLYRPNSPHRHRPPCRGLKDQRLGRQLSFGRIELIRNSNSNISRAPPLAHGIEHYNGCELREREYNTCNIRATVVDASDQTLQHSPIHRLWD